MEKIVFKLCFDKQIHRCPRTPESFDSLLAIVKQTFKEVLPEKFNLSYIDQEGDRVLLHEEDDFKSMIDSFGPEVKSIKVFVAPEGQDEIPEGMLGSKSFISDVNSSFQVLLNKKEVQEEPVKEKKSEVSSSQNIEKKEEQKPIEPNVEITMIHAKKKTEEIPQVEAPKPLIEKKEEIKIEEAVIVKENDELDLSKKSNLRAFIIQTIEESMPQIMANYTNNKNQDDKKKKDENPVKKGIMNIANQISNKVEKIVIGEKPSLDGEVTNLEKIIPEAVTTSDEQVYAVVTIRNHGTEAFPSNPFLQNTGGVYGDITKVPSLDPKKEFRTTIVLKGPKRAGSFISKWRLGYIDQRNVTKYFGEEFELKFTVSDKKYSKEVEDVAKLLKELLPQADLTECLEFASKNPNKSVEALIEEFLGKFSN